MENKLCFSVYGELYVVDLDRMLYFEADDHYTHVYYSSGTHFMIPFGLAKVEAALSNKGRAGDAFLRLGRKYIVNIRRVFHDQRGETGGGVGRRPWYELHTSPA